MHRNRNINQFHRILLMRRVVAYLLILRSLKFILHNLQEEKTETTDDGTINGKEVENRQGDKVKQPYTYTAREWDEEIKQYFNRARYRDPYTGIFITKDPILHPVNGPPQKSCNKGIPSFASLLYTPQSFNPYIYVTNSPLMKSDPFGLYPGPCGNEGNQWVPDYPYYMFNFTWQCQAHDNCYGCEGARAGKSKMQCDLEFYFNMSTTCIIYGPALMPSCLTTASIYYGAVSVRGGDAFKEARKKCCAN